MEPCVTPACISQCADILPSMETMNFLFERNKLLSLIMLFESCNLDNLYNKLGCCVVSKVSSISKNIGAIYTLLLKFNVT
jgi:hypothetical protein